MSEKKESSVTIHILSEEKPQVFTPAGRAKSPGYFQHYLKKARDTRYTAVCGCDQNKELRLYVRADPRTGTFSLRRFPFTGPSHAETCSYYCRVNLDGGASTYGGEVIREDPDGTLRIALSYSLRVSVDKPENPQPEPTLPARRRQATQKLPHTSLLGLLHLLWENTETNVWSPAFEGRRQVYGIMHRLHNDAQTIRQGHTRLSDVLLLQERIQDNRTAFSYAAKNSRRLIVISELSPWTPAMDKHQGTLPVCRLTDNKRLYLNIDETRWKDALERFHREAAWWRDGGKVIAIAVTDVPVEGNYHRALVRQVCLMMVSPRYIPLDSSYEGIVEEKLFRERRAFVKPLIYDSAENEYHPDFCLTDVESADIYPMEVWGMETTDYQLHREQKTQWYNQEYPSSWWAWDVDTDTVPLLPHKCDYHQARYPWNE